MGNNGVPRWKFSSSNTSPGKPAPVPQAVSVGYVTQIKPKIDKIDTLEQKIDAVEQKVDAVEQKVDAVEQKIDAVETKVSNLDTKVFNIDARLSNVEKLIDDIRKILNWIGGGIGAILLSLLANFIYGRFL